MISFAKKSIGFILGFLILTFLLETTINFAIKKIKVGEYGVLNKINSGLINTDILILGSSRALKAINPAIIEKHSGLSCYNIAADGADLGVQLPKLKWYLNNNKKPKILIQDIAQFGDVISNRVYEPFKYLPYLNDDSLYYGLLRVDSDFWFHKYFFPSNLIYYNFDFYTKLFQELYLTLKDNDIYVMGFLPDNSKWSANFELLMKEHPEGFSAFVSEEYASYLNELKQVCKENDIILLLTVLPVYQKIQDITKNKEAAINFYLDLEEAPHVYYLDFLDSDFTAEVNNFYNFTHVNINGANKFSELLANRVTIIFNQTIDFK